MILQTNLNYLFFGFFPPDVVTGSPIQREEGNPNYQKLVILVDKVLNMDIFSYTNASLHCRKPFLTPTDQCQAL